MKTYKWFYQHFYAPEGSPSFLSGVVEAESETQAGERVAEICQITHWDSDWQPDRQDLVELITQPCRYVRFPTHKDDYRTTYNYAKYWEYTGK